GGGCGGSRVGGVEDMEWVAGSDWPDGEGSRAAVSAGGFACNAIALVGHNTIRSIVIGRDQPRAATTAERSLMRDHVRRAMEQGACGLSTGLIYTPGKWAPVEE